MLSNDCIVCTHALSLQLRMVSNGVVLSLVSPLAFVVSGVVTRCSIVAQHSKVEYHTPLRYGDALVGCIGEAFLTHPHHTHTLT